MLQVCTFGSNLAFNRRYRPSLCAAALTELRVRVFVRLVYGILRGLEHINCTRCPSYWTFALVPLSPALLDVDKRLKPLSAGHGTRYDAAPGLLVFEQLFCIDWTDLGNAESSRDLWLYDNLKNDEALMRLLSSASYCVQPAIDVLMASRLSKDYFWPFAPPDRLRAAPKNGTNLVVVEISESPMPNLSDSSISFGPLISAVPPAPQGH